MKDRDAAKLMGQIVTVNRIAERAKCIDKAWAETSACEPRAGWVVGVRTMSLGVIHGSNVPDADGECDGRWLDVQETRRHLAVAFWPSMKPVLVPMDGFVPGGTPVSPSKHSWDEFAKSAPPAEMERVMKAMREVAARTPRVRGKFSRERSK